MSAESTPMLDTQIRAAKGEKRISIGKDPNELRKEEVSVPFIKTKDDKVDSYSKMLSIINTYKENEWVKDPFLAELPNPEVQPNSECELKVKGELLDILCSPNGEFLVGLTKGENGIFIYYGLKNISYAPFRKTPKSDKLVMDSDFLDTHKNFTFVELYPMGEEDKENHTQKDINYCFFPDSTGLVVTVDSQVMVISLSYPTEYWKYTRRNLPNLEGSKIKFMYFSSSNFGSVKYQTLDHHQLVIGHEKGIQVTYFQLDNYIPTKDSPIPEFQTKEIKCNGYTEWMQKDTEALTDTNKKKATNPALFYHNNGGIVLAVKQNTKGRKSKLQVFKFNPYDVDDMKFKLKIKEDVEIPTGLKIFWKSISSNGQYVYCFNSKRGAIQKLHLQSKAGLQPVMKLNSKQRNLKHLAVKEDGKYLLIVDAKNTAEVLVHNGTEYASLTSFKAKIPKSTTQQKNNRGGKTSGKATTKGEHDLSDMDFLEDGSGIICKDRNVITLTKVSLPKPSLNYSLTLRDHFYFSYFFKYVSGKYRFMAQAGEEAGWIWKTIDFDSEIKVRTICMDKGERMVEDPEKSIFASHFFYGHGLESTANSTDPNYSSDTARSEDLKQYLQNHADDWGVEIMDIPNCNNQIYNVKIKEGDKRLIAAFTDKDNQGRVMTTPRLVWSVKVDDFVGNKLLPKIENHCNFFFDNQGKYLVIPQENTALVLSLKDGSEVARIPGGDCFYFISSTKVLVAIAGEDTENEDQLVVKHRIFDLTKNNFDGIDDSELCKKHEDCGYQMAYSTDERYKVLLGKRRIGILDTELTKFVYEDEVVDPSEHVLVSQHIEAPDCLISSDNRWMVISTLENPDKFTLYSVQNKRPPRTFTLKNKDDVSNKWHFSQDSKYLLLRHNNHILVYQLPESDEKDAGEMRLLTKIPLEKELVKLATVLYINVLNDSASVELVAGFKNKIFFRRIPFYAKQSDLYISAIGEKLNEYSKEVNNKKKTIFAENIGSIMAAQSSYQRYLTPTYFRILCLFDSKSCISAYFKRMENTDVLFRFKPYVRLVCLEKTKGCDKSNRDKWFKNNSANCLIDCMEEIIQNKSKFPPTDNLDFIIDEWLRAGCLQTKYERKLLKLITLEPLGITVSGELKNELSAVCSVKEEFKKTSQWLSKLKEPLFEGNSLNFTNYNVYRTGLDFDLSMGSWWSVQYFGLLENASDDDLKDVFKPIIYYKWNKIFWPAMIYSMIYWSLNILFCAFMGFEYRSVVLGVIIMALNALFILFDLKCFITQGLHSLRVPWNYFDLTIHFYSIACVLSLLIVPEDAIDSKYHWLRITSFVLISIRGLTMLRVFMATRYLITMLFAVFYEMVAFLSVFGYMIFIYWFIVLVRPSLIQDGQDEELYTSFQAALNTAFGGFSSDFDYTVGLVSSVAGQIILGLVLLNYLIAIVSGTYERIADDKDLYDIKMLVTLITEFDSFMYGLRRNEHKKRYYILLPTDEEEQNDEETEAQKQAKINTLIDNGNALQDNITLIQDYLEPMVKHFKAHVQGKASAFDKMYYPAGENKSVLLNENNRPILKNPIDAKADNKSVANIYDIPEEIDNKQNQEVESEEDNTYSEHEDDETIEDQEEKEDQSDMSSSELIDDLGEESEEEDENNK